ncbi:MAG: dGTP triphosphohydrolase [Patescibacteria group bacterium]
MLLKRTDLEKRERELFAPYATFSDSAKREHPDSQDEFRTQFQRDHARIIHSKSFRRLKGKTQVFVAHHGDHYRNRLTHTLEVSQISRNLARNLAVNEDLAGAIALAHDLGHTPFGHAGEGRLNSLLQKFNSGFEHNRQSRRILTTLEKKYVGFDGLNLTFDLLDGLAKHSTPYDFAENSNEQPSLEAQIVNLADEIAYTNHDLDDGLRGKIFTRADLKNLKMWGAAIKKVDSNLPDEAFSHRAVSAIIDLLTTDLLWETSKNLEENKIKSLNEIKNFHEILVSFSPSTQKDLEELREFLRAKFYLHPEVKKLSERGADMLEKLFTSIFKKPELLPAEFTAKLKIDSREIVVADFVAGMTDDFAEEFVKKARG